MLYIYSIDIITEARTLETLLDRDELKALSIHVVSGMLCRFKLSQKYVIIHPGLISRSIESSESW